MAAYIFDETEATVQEKLKAVLNDVAVMFHATEVFEHSCSKEVGAGLRQGLGDAFLKLRDIIAELNQKKAA